MDVHIGLPGGIVTEDIALHRGAKLEMLMDEPKRVEVTECRAEKRNLPREAEHLSEEGAMDEIAVHLIVHCALEGAVSSDQQTKLGRADGEMVGEMNVACAQFDGTVEGPEDIGASQQTLEHL